VDVRSHLGGERPHGRGCVVLTASSSTEYAFEGDHRSGRGEASVFTRAVVAGLETGEADLDGDGLISVDELYDFVFEKVRRDTARQTPGKGAEVSGDIVIARSVRGPRTDDAPTSLPADVLEAVASPRPSARAGAVADLAELLQRSDHALADAAGRTLDELARDHSPVVSAAALAAKRGQRFTWVKATRASRVAFWIGAAGVLLLLLANATRLHDGGDETLSGSMFAYQTLGVAVAAAAVALAFLGSRASAQLTIGALVGVAAASGIGAVLALIDVGGNYIVPRFPGSADETLFEGDNGLAQRYDAYLSWTLGAIALLVAGLVLATLAFGVRSPARERRSARARIAADAALVTGAGAMLAGVLTAPEAFASELSSVRLGPGEGHGWQPLILAAAATAIVGTQRLMSSEFRPALRGLVLGLAWVAFLYCLGVVQLIRGPGRPSPGILIALVGAAVMVVAAALAVAPPRGRQPDLQRDG
jgi:hypothetical protein